MYLETTHIDFVLMLYDFFFVNQTKSYYLAKTQNEWQSESQSWNMPGSDPASQHALTCGFT